MEAVVGAACGVFVRLWSNGAQGQRYLWRPWNLVLFGGIGAYIGSNNERWQKSLLDDLNERRVAKGFPPILREEVGWTSFIGSRYESKANTVLEEGKRDR